MYGMAATAPHLHPWGRMAGHHMNDLEAIGFHGTASPGTKMTNRNQIQMLGIPSPTQQLHTSVKCSNRFPSHHHIQLVIHHMSCTSHCNQWRCHIRYCYI